MRNAGAYYLSPGATDKPGAIQNIGIIFNDISAHFEMIQSKLKNINIEE